MRQQRLALYTVNMKLIRNMHNQGDDHVYSVSPQTGKSARPFVGIIVVCNERQYCVPLSSPKQKHKSMTNSIDFHRIEDSRGKLIGVLDFNSMIPVRPDVVQKIDVRISPNDNASTKHYKNLLLDQIAFCQQNQDTLVKKANILYTLVTTRKAKKALRDRCLNWERLEAVLDRFKAASE